MGLREYQHRRNFTVTAEPNAAKSKARASATRTPIFVIQLHHARRRHYDFRLQVGNALKSWAVPKGPSFDPSVKRLAVEVEDHPLAYAKFEGDIPEGNYGAGHVQIFDRGTWSPIVHQPSRSKSATAAAIQRQLAKGHLEFELNGERLHGAWHLVRTQREERQPQWMLIKAHDEYAATTEADDLLDQPLRSAKEKRGGNGKRAKHAAAQRRKPVAKAAKKQPARSASAHNWNKPALGLDKATKQALTVGPFEPELAHSVANAPQGSNWLHETKWDGYRLLTTVTTARGNSKAQLWSRNHLEWTERVPTITQALTNLKLREAQLDGELIVLQAGMSSFNKLQAVLAGESDAPLIYAVFDLLHLDGVSLRDCALLDRKELLRQVLQTAPSPQLLFSEHHIGDGPQIFALAAQQGLEGIVSKRTTAPYRAGRGNDWVKVKSVLSDEFAIVGYTAPRGSRQGIGALLLARPSGRTNSKQDAWHFMGRVGSGFSDVLLKRLAQLLPKTHSDKTPVDNESLVDRDIGKATWVKPRYVAEVYFRGLGKEGLLRQASLKALREDKSINDLRQRPDTPVQPAISASKTKAAKRSTRNAAAATKAARLVASPVALGSNKKTAAKRTASNNNSRVTKPAKQLDLGYVTHPERVVFPADGITKLQVAEYYEGVMPWLLPQIANRPLSLLRCPGGIKTCFFQKHHDAHLGAHVRALPITNSTGATENYLYVDEAQGVRELVQMNVLEFHPWGTTIDDMENTDMLTFDLDPGPRVSWERVIGAADLLRELLVDIGLQSFVKLSGGKGLHVIVPLHPAQPWAHAKQSCKQIAMAVANSRPKEFIAVATKAKRSGKIFIDYLRNGRGATSVAAYSLRARATAPAAMPLEWREIHKTTGGADYHLANTINYLQSRKHDPWKEWATLKQTINEKVS